MVKLQLYFVTVTVSPREKDPVRIARRYEDDLRINRLIEESRSKWDRNFLIR